MHKKYRKRADATIAAIQLDLVTEGITYQKWGGEQHCNTGDWLVNNQGDTYTVARESFAKSYEIVSPGIYRKSTIVWAEQADRAGSVETKEGRTAYRPGDYVVSNCEDGSDAYAVSQATFVQMYEPVA